MTLFTRAGLVVYYVYILAMLRIYVLHILLCFPVFVQDLLNINWSKNAFFIKKIVYIFTCSKCFELAYHIVLPGFWQYEALFY